MRNLIFFCFFFLSACTALNVYKPYSTNASGGNGFGYKERKLDEGQYVLEVVYSSPVIAKQYWHKRAKELCSETPYKHNIYKADRDINYYGSYGARPGAFNYEGTLECLKPEIKSSEL